MLAKVNIDLDQKQLREYINQRIDENMRQHFLIIDINKMAELTCMSKSTLENDILHDPRIRIYERRKEKGKRYWLYEPAMEAIKSIIDEW